MRTDQYMGLSPRAQEFLENNGLKCIITQIKEFPKDPIKKTVTSERKVWTELWREPYDEIEGAFGNKFSLYMYRLSDRTKIIEEIQEQPWSSGPCFFLCLKYKKTDVLIPDTRWTEQEIEDSI